MEPKHEKENAIKKIASQNSKCALVIGNGPNLKAELFPEWKELVLSAADENLRIKIEGLTNTELYDLIEIHAEDFTKIKERIVKMLELPKQTNLEIHENLMSFAIERNIPVLTTNFDEAFKIASNSRLFKISSSGFTDFYPWKTYYGIKQHENPVEGFGIWHLHGMIYYYRSIRLGLTDYMGAVEKARKLIHNGDDRLFQGKRQKFWKGYQTWLHIWFNLPLIIFGFGYGSDEVFLRWLLIERKRYFNLIGEPMRVWYISTKEPNGAVKNLMENLDVEIKLINSHKELYNFN